MIETMLFHNPTEHTINLDALGMDPVLPDGEVAIPLHMAAPLRTDNGNRGKSPVEQVAPQLRPKNPTDLKAWLAIPEPVKQESKIVTISARSPSEPAGVRALREKKEAEARKLAASVQNKPQQATGSLQTSVSAPASKP
jgi:hypothetical protein